MVDERLRHRAYTREVGDDPPDVRDWTWRTGEAATRAPERARARGQCRFQQPQAQRPRPRPALWPPRSCRLRARRSTEARSPPRCTSSARSTRSGIESSTAATRYLKPVRIDDDVLAGLRELSDLAPLHQAKSIAALEAVSGSATGLPGGGVL
jgi:hypothetical protein